jgi:hypothetical protein
MIVLRLQVRDPTLLACVNTRGGSHEIMLTGGKASRLSAAAKRIDSKEVL